MNIEYKYELSFYTVSIVYQLQICRKPTFILCMLLLHREIDEIEQRDRKVYSKMFKKS